MFSCLIVAILLRLATIVSFPDQLIEDRDAYLGIARAVAQGRGFSDPNDLLPTAFRPPAYPLQLAGLMVALPEPVAVALVNLVWGGIAVWSTAQIGRILGLQRFAIFSAMLVAADPMLLDYSTQPMTEATCTGLTALLLYWIIRQDRRRCLQQFVIGLLFGLLVMCRPTFWPFAIIALLGRAPIQLADWPRLLRDSRSRRNGLLAVAGTLLIVGPWVVRNQLVMGWPILTTTHGGYTLLLANNPVFYTDVVERNGGKVWEKSSFDRWQSDLQSEMRKELGPQTSELLRDRWQTLRAREFIRSAPGRFLHAVAYRIRSLWSFVPQADAAAKVGFWGVTVVAWYYGAVMVAFMAGAIAVVASGRLRQWWPLFALVLTVQLVHLAYWTNARMRAPLIPAISLFAVAPFCRRAHLVTSAQPPVQE